MYSAGDVRVVSREDPKIIEPTDAIIKLSATCICGSDLWPYRGIEPADHQVMGHEYIGVVEEIGSAVETMKVGDSHESTMQASHATRGGGHLGYVGVNYEVKIPGIELFFCQHAPPRRPCACATVPS